MRQRGSCSGRLLRRARGVAAGREHQRDLDAPVARAVRGRIVRRDRIERAAPFGGDPLGAVEPRGDQAADRLRALARQIPVRCEARGVHRRVVGVAAHAHVALHPVQRVGHAREHRHVAIDHRRRAGAEQAVAAQHDHAAVGLVAHAHEPRGDLRLEELRDARRGRRMRRGRRRLQLRHVQRVDRREQPIRMAGERDAQPREHAEAHEQRERDAHPQRHREAPRDVARDDVAPMRRERRIEFAAHRADRLRELAAHRVELRAAVVEHAVAPLEAEREAEVQQLEQVEMLARLLRQPLKQMEELLAAPRLVVERHEQAMRRPYAAAPRRQRGGLVERGAQAVARADDRLGGDARLLRALLELADLDDEMLAQPRGIRMMDGRTDLRHEVQQRVRGRDERIRAARRPAARPRLKRGRTRRRRGGRVRAARIRRHESARAGRERIGRSVHRAISPSPANRPELHRESREFAGEMKCEAARAFELFPHLAALVDLEVRVARVIRNLPRRDGQLPHRDARQLQLHEIANALDGTELRLRGKARAQAVGRHVGAHGEHEARRVAQRRIGDRRDLHAVAHVAQLDLDRVLLEHRRQ
ncbi:hypothetical protein BURPS1710b_A1206 [Burkholderia pseudomallei 1710b]|uniref:Uncharacterized protein n=1 Tax=Burkholderia pseudomallei (strain 1710b) TaxID=320372 RepID=Q3JJ91_BURP1|nr:hypothetical protein BURPS1710b_A1206 [Burkholderia pseudomallei 1710b]